ncbi:unnamed protein product [Trichobilharzia regenti]|nr:unnamed protein product [Trichobilharzia regenti]
MISSAYQLCSLSMDEESSSKIQLACEQMEQLVPQVINMAYLLFKYPSSKVKAIHVYKFIAF